MDGQNMVLCSVIWLDCCLSCGFDIFLMLQFYGTNLFVAHQTLCITGFNFETESLVVCANLFYIS